MLKHIAICAAALLFSIAGSAWAAIDTSILKALVGDDPDAKVAAVSSIAILATQDAVRLLEGLAADQVYASPDGTVFLLTDGQAYFFDTETKSLPPTQSEAITVNNRLRSAIAAALSGLQLLTGDTAQRKSAALSLSKAPDPLNAALIQKALATERNSEVRALLENAQAVIQLQSADVLLRRSASAHLIHSTDTSLAPILKQLLEPDELTRKNIQAALKSISAAQARAEFVGNFFYGVSLGSVLLLAALGLAITFGLMGVINMAHGELLMIGAYTTYLTQGFFRHHFPSAVDAYLLLALPAAFLLTAAVGMILERLIIRRLYGRPLETLLCTWGISLILMQLIRTLFGAQNVEVANPSWMSGGITILGGLVLSYNRIVIIVFSFAVLLGVWALLNKTRLGLFVRAVTQNRRMADCVGVPTSTVDMLTFGLGSGIAGLAGVALSQLGNVGPDLGQSFIIDSFMVVVLGGVGQLAGTVIAAIGLGEANKFLEPFTGAVMAKISILVFIVAFIQSRPQGLFALKGRSLD